MDSRMAKRLVVFILLEVILCMGRLSSSAHGQGDCTPDGHIFRDECFWMHPYSAQWANADYQCREYKPGARLVTIIDQEMNDFLVGIIREDAWVGLHDTHNESDWRWADDAPVNYTNFPDDQTDDVSVQMENNCVVLQPNGKWKDIKCREYKRILCAVPRVDPICPNGGTYFRDRCYWYGGDSKDWEEANVDCGRFGDGVKLPVIYDAELNAFLARVINPRIWIGLRGDSEGSMEWVDGRPLNETSFHSWKPGEPNGVPRSSCVVLNHKYSPRKWMDVPCTSNKNRYVCAMQPCYGGGISRSKDGNQEDQTQKCLDFGAEKCTTCVSDGQCREYDGTCLCEPLFDGMACDQDDMAVAMHGPNRTVSGENVTFVCHLNLPSTDVTISWQKAGGAELLPKERTRTQDLPVQGDYKLLIEGVQKEDAGMYECVAITKIVGIISVTKTEHINLVVEEAPIKPSISAVSSDDEDKSTGLDKGVIIAMTFLGICLCVIVVAVIALKVKNRLPFHSNHHSKDGLKLAQDKKTQDVDTKA